MNDRLWSEAVIIEAPGRQLRVESTREIGRAHV